MAVGGLAARAWGGPRDLVDLDFYVADRHLTAAAHALAHAVRRGPARVVSDHWDVAVLVLELHGCRVELGGADTARYRDGVHGVWRDADVNPAVGVGRQVLGVPVTVMPRDGLIAYKRALGRDVDLVDLHHLAGEGGPVETRLAVYGTLAPGEINHGIVAGLGGAWTSGAVHGELHPTGWGMTYGFPALRWHPDAPEVPVQLLTTPALPAAWDRIDRFEGEAYRRIVVPVTVGAERTLANIYVAAALA